MRGLGLVCGFPDFSSGSVVVFLSARESAAFWVWWSRASVGIIPQQDGVDGAGKRRGWCLYAYYFLAFLWYFMVGRSGGFQRYAPNRSTLGVGGRYSFLIKLNFTFHLYTLLESVHRNSDRSTECSATPCWGQFRDAKSIPHDRISIVPSSMVEDEYMTNPQMGLKKREQEAILLRKVSSVVTLLVTIR